MLREDRREQLKTSAALAALQFSSEDIEAIRDEGDMETELFRELVARAEQIRLSIPDVEYLYVMRRTEDPHALAFVIENDILLPEDQRDRNGNGRGTQASARH